ncbi:hypothetical protein V6N11_068973 [Hibiscus sabdariffa]|uniref:Uncharacterized protein n=1 Tax=Hibiscus sabdariffa TaxID=183260 RepID=A0ABR2PBB0_9ROSI
MRGTCPLSISRTICIPLWHALSSVWDVVRDNVYWLVGNGADIHVWDDTWVSSLGPLRQWLRLPKHVVDNIKFNDLLLHNGQWDIDQLRELLHHDVISHIIGILPPALDNSHDVVVWRCTPTGIFSIASAYIQALEPLWDDVDLKWSHL